MQGAMRALIAVVVVMVAASATAEVQPEYGWPRPIHWPWWPAPSTPPPPPPPPPPQSDPWWCNRTYGSEAFSGADAADDCPPPPAPPTTTTPPPPSCSWPCFCPRLPPRPGGVVGPASAATTACHAPLAAVRSCGPFLTGADDRTPTATSPCCMRMRTVLNSTGAAADTAAAGGGGDRLLLGCLCPLILGDVGRVLPKAVEPIRLMYLPVACGFFLPPQILYLCYSGRASAPVVGSFSELGH